jgi:hypothetical protein
VPTALQVKINSIVKTKKSTQSPEIITPSDYIEEIEKPHNATIDAIVNDIKPIESITQDELNTIIQMLDQMTSDVLTKLSKKISFLERKKVITKDAVIYLIVREFSIIVKTQHIIPTEEENKITTQFAIKNLINSNPEVLISQNIKKIPSKPQEGQKQDKPQTSSIQPKTSSQSSNNVQNLKQAKTKKLKVKEENETDSMTEEENEIGSKKSRRKADKKKKDLK